MNEFTVELDNKFILQFGEKKQKHNLTDFLNKNFKIDKDFIIQKNINQENKKQNGGQNKLNYLMTEKTAELLKNSYNLKNRYITKINDVEIKCIVMTIENSTLGFICNSLKSLPIQFIRQYKIGKYYIDLYIPELLLLIECDEFGHINYDKNKEEERKNYILKQNNNYKFIRFNPNEKDFDLSNIISEILSIYIKK